ncbi:AAA family ATPase [Curtobacterium sp. 9128]|uniref:AAA family ATPase n=1 Tax=Curtobacterium sp. 9128 TaxID=1793722 RepID=UPI00119F6885|nr:AAA family ATPase [Curtobacterium sp. 9128]
MTRAQNRLKRLREALRYLDEQGGSARRLDVWDHVLSVHPLEGDELNPNTKGKPLGNSDFFWGSAGLVNAGFMEKPKRGEWLVTDLGRDYSSRDRPLEEFGSELSARQREFERLKNEDVALRLATEIVAPNRQAEVIRATALIFSERGLRDLDSVFAPGRAVWRRGVVAELRERFIGKPDVLGAGFLDKIAVQFDGASDDAKLLMAELLCWQVLPLEQPGERKKRERVTFLLDKMEHPVTIPSEIDDAFRSWSFNPGQGISGHMFDATSMLIECVDAWLTLTDDARAEALEDPTAWREVVAGLPGTALPIQRNELLFLVHPEYFGEVVSSDNREAIRAAFAGEVEGQMEDDPDAAFQQITIALQQKVKGPALYYVEPLVSRWQKRLPVEPPVIDPPVPGPDPVRSGFPSADGILANGLHMPLPWLQETLDLIERRKQVILYGPPGTGKTFLAQALAKHVTKGGDDGETVIVQFHPTYSYEDFFEGFRPVANDDGGNLAFTLRKGPLRRLADAAAANPEANYFLVIDEINRGNIAKVFGELYFLLEYRDSEISLLYSDEPFTLPSNIFVIGTMNTADRSIAMLDAAMRRRFAFIELHPGREPVQNVLARWVATNGLQDDRADLLTRLNAQIQDHDAKVGPSFLMRDLAGSGLQDVWRYEILPLLAEHHYGEGVDLEARYGLATLRRQPAPAAADGAEGASVDD